jgi:hypothetical protein
MKYTLKYLDKNLFDYNNASGDVICPYCQTTYGINSLNLQSQLNECIQKAEPITAFRSVLVGDTEEVRAIVELPRLLMRCIHCDLQPISSDSDSDSVYPFKRIASFKPNREQTAIILDLYQDFLLTTRNDTFRTFFLIEGLAGTGKTSLIAYFLSYEEFSKDRICFSAPTNIALNVLMEKLQSNATDKSQVDDRPDQDDSENERSWEFKTVFRLLGNKVSINSQGQTLFSTSTDAHLRLPYDRIIVDEVSMADRKNLEQILITIESLKRTRQMLGLDPPTIIFLGDLGQLPPINEEQSIIFNKTTQSQYFIKRLELTEIMRSKDLLVNLSLDIRTLIPINIHEKIGQDRQGTNLKKYTDAGSTSTGSTSTTRINYHNNRTKWIESYILDFKLTPKTPPVMLSYTNNECDDLNILCRDRIFDNPSEKYVNGELIVFNNYYSLSRRKKLTSTGSSSLTEPYICKFYTSEPFVVTQLETQETTLKSLDFDQIWESPGQLFEKIVKKLNKNKESKIKKDYILDDLKVKLAQWSWVNNVLVTSDQSLDRIFNRLAKQISGINHKYQVYELSRSGVGKLDPLDSEPDNCKITVIQETDIDRYKLVCTQIRDLIKKAFGDLVLIYRSNQTVKFLIDYLFERIWLSYYYRSYIWPFADIVYGYAITIYKSQGSTYPNVYVNIPNIMGCKKVSNTIKMKSLYTSMTRPSHKINVLHNSHMVLPLLPETMEFKCHLCKNTTNSTNFSPVNCTFDKACIDNLLLGIQPMTLYTDEANVVIFADKSKNLYRISADELPECHINDVYSYLSEKGLFRNEIDKYQNSNVIEAMKLLKIT